jgi:hypothetical protein
VLQERNNIATRCEVVVNNTSSLGLAEDITSGHLNVNVSWSCQASPNYQITFSSGHWSTCLVGRVDNDCLRAKHYVYILTQKTRVKDVSHIYCSGTYGVQNVCPQGVQLMSVLCSRQRGHSLGKFVDFVLHDSAIACSCSREVTSGEVDLRGNGNEESGSKLPE